MRPRLAAGGLAAPAALPPLPAAAAAALHFTRRCTGTVDTQCYDTDCGFVDCTTYDCVLYLDPLNEPLLDICVGQARSPR